MREILFRGKRVDNGEWVEGDFCHPSNICKESIGYDEQLKQSGIPIWEDYNIRTETVGQYTGLTDKNGKKIFEGDIIKYDKDGAIYIVVFAVENGISKFCSKDLIDGNLGYVNQRRDKIIGNIHDNPELLK